MKIDFRKFTKYINDWNALDREYNSILKIPIYHFIKQMIILNKKSKLTKEYSDYLDKCKENNINKLHKMSD